MTREDAILLIVDLGSGGCFETLQNKETAIQRLMKVELSDFYDIRELQINLLDSIIYKEEQQ